MRILCPLRLVVQEHGIVRGLRQAGCEVLVLDGTPVQRAQLARAVEGFHPDLLFSYGWWHGRLFLEDIDWLCAHYHLPHAYWASDDPTHHATTSLPMGHLADLVFTTTEELCEVYHAAGKKTALLQFACNPELHHKVVQDGVEHRDFVLIANNYSLYDPAGVTYRTRCARMMLGPIIEAGLDLKVFGDGWGDARHPFHIPARFVAPPVPYEQQAIVYSAAKIVLGLQNEGLWSTQTSCRLFEVLGCQVCHLAPMTRSTARLFVPGRHLLLSGSAAETVALAHYYLEHDEERKRIASAGQQEVYSRHTYAHRAREFLSKLEEVL